MRINTNISALNTQGRLNAAQTQMSKSLEKLSSGLRIGRASDDAAGLAITEKMRGQIKGLDRAGKNATEAISLIQTAEGALNESHSILQRMRELAGQAASDTATATDRNEMQKEVDQLASELTRITNTTQFNTKNLLSGAYTGQRFQIGANTGQDISLNIEAVDAYSLGLTASKGITIADGNALSNSTLSPSALATTGSYTLEGVISVEGTKSIGTMGKDTASTGVVNNTIGGADRVNWTAKSGYAAISIEGNGGAADTASFSWDATTKTLNIKMGAGTTGAQLVTRYNAWIAGGSSEAQAADARIGAVNGTANSGQAVEFTTNRTVIGASTDKAEVTLTSIASGTKTYALQFTNTGGANADPTISMNGDTIVVNLSSNGNTIDSVVNAINNDIVTSKLVKASFGTGTTTGSFINGSQAAEAQVAGTNSSVNLTLKDSSGKVVDFKANQNSTTNFTNGIETTLSNDVANKLRSGDSLTTVRMDVVAKESEAASVGGQGIISKDATVEKGILINTQDNASKAISVIDNAINTVSSARSNLGAIQNRLEHTISNLSVTQENMTSAESNIRDVDMAAEMSNFTKNQILSQAATAMLAQANQVPQGVLKLLG